MSDLQARELAEPDITPAHRDSYDINIYIVVWQTVFVTKFSIITPPNLPFLKGEERIRAPPPFMKGRVGVG